MRNKNASPLVAMILHGIFMFAVLGYAALAHFLAPRVAASNAISPVVLYVLVGLALYQIPLAFFLPKFLAKKGSNAAAAFIVSDACFEAIAVYGLVGAFVGMPLLWVDALMVLSFIMLAINSIRLGTMRDIVDQESHRRA